MKPQEGPITSAVAVTAAPTTPSRAYWLEPAGFVRTAQESETTQAATLTLLNQWSHLNSPGQGPPSNEIKTMRIDSFPFEMSLLGRLDYPALFRWRAEEHAPMTSAVLFALNANMATVLDPLNGILQVSRQQLPKHVVGNAMIFWQPLPGIFPPFHGEGTAHSSHILQQLLDQQGFGNKNEEDTIEQRTEKGIRDLQQFYGFESTGIFTKEVHLVLGKEVLGRQVPSLMLPPSLPISPAHSNASDPP